MSVSSESFARCFEKVITGRRSKTKRMAAKPSTTTTAKATYSPIDPTRKNRPPIFSGSDVDWLRPDSRGFHQCRPACKLTLFSILLISLFFFFWVSFLSSLLGKIGTCVTFDQALNVGPFSPLINDFNYIFKKNCIFGLLFKCMYSSMFV